MVRKSPLLGALFVSLMQDVLAATVLQPKREWYLSDLAGHLGVAPSSLQRPLSKLVASGILRRRANGNRVYYSADPECPILPELTGILTKTAGIAEPLRKALEPLAREIVAAFIHGSVAEARERSESDIDLIIIGSVSSPDLALALRGPQEQLGRTINFTRYSPAEFAAKRAGRHHFLSSVLSKPKIFLIGGDDDLDRLGDSQTRSARAHEQAGARRAARNGRH